MVQLPATAAVEYVAARTRTRTKTKTVRGCVLSEGLMSVPPKVNAYTYRVGFLYLASQRDGQTDKKTDKKTTNSAP